MMNLKKTVFCINSSVVGGKKVNETIMHDSNPNVGAV